ncbi:AAA family ATPase [Mucilaginibacter galii]|uniref:ATPase AAA-type core domain-containing protein n=1 Tax=Mucilaginibacter galii TaxID=2005073 RepID=A0A917J7D8_9SPHI|nr:AAA family ATPase [Mucilaginibacter galii]GGI50453.1 hypothetical protein GCM10011425_16650 [Mucilaginibacter galii]
MTDQQTKNQFLLHSEKPAVLAGEPFPYNRLPNPKRFEELLYSIFDVLVENAMLARHNRISLMPGVADDGKDCVLSMNGDTNGIIQCKQYNNNLSKDEFGKEVTKFALYSLINPALITDPNNFTYYIAVAKNFVKDCSDFIDDFNRLIQEEDEITKWISFNLNKYAKLTTLKIREAELPSEVIAVLQGITIKKLNHQDLDNYLSMTEMQHLIGQFFGVRTVIDNRELAALKQEIKFFNSKELSKSNIDRELQRSSISLRAERNEFLGISDSHIERAETELLYQWLTKTLKKDDRNRLLNFCLLAGNAGIGKTVIVKDLYDRLLKEGIPVLGLKADKIISASIAELQDKIALSIPIYDFIENCKRVYPTTILVIDQIDALSQSMSSNKSYLQVFKDLIEQYTHDPNVRIIVSVRLADLQFDPSLKVYKNIETIKVGPLPDDAIFTQLKKIGISQDAVPDKLLNLLRTPIHLNIFSQIAKRKKHLGLTNIQQIYQIYWRDKIINVPASTKITKGAVKQLVYDIAQRMFKSNTITVSTFQFEDYADELNYMASERIIKIEDNLLQFFHQSFYDFAFSKQFVEAGNDVHQYLMDQEQSIHIRSAVRMIVNYYRDYDPVKYNRLLTQIFNDSGVLFHLKHLLFTSLLQHEYPTNDEKTLVLEEVKNSFQMQLLYLETASSNTWFDFAINHGMLDVLNKESHEFAGHSLGKSEFNYYKNAAFFFLRSFTTSNYQGAWNFTQKLTDNSTIVNILYTLTNWSNPISFELFERCHDQAESDSFAYYHILANIANDSPDFALEKIEETLPGRNKSRDASYRDYEEHEVLKSLAKDLPEKLIDILYRTISSDFRLDQLEGYEDDYFIINYDYAYTDLRDDDTLTGKEYLYRLLAVCLKRAAAKNHPEFDRFFGEHVRGRYKAVLRLLIFALQDNELAHIQKVYELFLFFQSINYFDSHSRLLGAYRGIFEKSFSHFLPDEQRNVLNTLSELHLPREIGFRKFDDGHVKFYETFGINKYAWMRRLPPQVFEDDAMLKLQFRGWQRKFQGSFKEARYSGLLMASAVENPIRPDRLAFMSNTQLLDSFRKYNSDVRDFGRNRGGLREHASAFGKLISKKTQLKHIEVIRASLLDQLIPLDYPLEGIHGWLEGDGDPVQIVDMARPLLVDNKAAQYEFICISIAKRLLYSGISDDWVVDFLIKKSLDFNSVDEDKEEDSTGTETDLNRGIWSRGASKNSGRAIRALLNVREDQQELVLDLFEKILQNGPDTAKAVVLHDFAYLMRRNPERAFKIFANALSIETDSHVLASSIVSANYLINYDFQRLIPGLRKLIALKNLGDEDSRNLFVVLFGAFLHGYEQSEDIVFQLVRENAKSARIAISEVMKYYYTIDGTKEKCNRLLHHVLEASTEEDHKELRWSFIQVEHLKLPDVFVFLKSYVQSKYFKMSEYFLEYLTFQCKDHVLLAIELFDMALDKNSVLNEEEERLSTNEQATKFIIGAFNSLQNQTNPNKSLNHKLLLSFDKVLMDFRYRIRTEKLLEELL